MSCLSSLESHPYWKSHFKYKCSECGNTDFEVKYVIRVYGDEVSIYPSSDNTYCWVCEEETNLLLILTEKD